MSLQTTPEVDRAWNTTESAQKEGNKGKGTEFLVQGVCTKPVPEVCYHQQRSWHKRMWKVIFQTPRANICPDRGEKARLQDQISVESRAFIIDLQNSALLGSKIQSMICQGQLQDRKMDRGAGCTHCHQDCTTVSITTSCFHVPRALQNADLWGCIFPCLLPAPKVNSFRNSEQNLFRDHGYYFWLLPGWLAWGRLNNNRFVPLSYNKSHHPSCEGEN